MTRIGILSFAHMHAAAYAHCLKQLANVEFVGIADEEASRGQAAATQFGTRFYPSYEALLAAGVDGVIVTSENAKHLPLVRMAAAAGADVLCEKPIATNMADGREIIRLCREAGVKLMIAFPVRYSPSVIALKKAVDSGQLGQIYAVKATNRGHMPGGWFTDLKLAGGGAVIDHTVHVMDLVNWFWHAPVRRVYAEVGQDLLWKEGCDDAGIITFELANGIFGTLDTSWSRPRTFPIWGDVTMDIVAQGGLVQMSVFEQTVQAYSDREGAVSWTGWGSDPDLGLIKDFVDVVSSDREPPITGEDGLYALEVALAAYAAAASGRVVELPLK